MNRPHRRTLTFAAPSRRLQPVLGLAGLLVLIALVLGQDTSEVFGSLALVRWWMVPVCGAFGLFLVLGTLSWRSLLTPLDRPRFALLLWARWIANSINNLLPVAQVGGDLVRIRLLMERRLPGPVAASSVVADVTLAVATQVGFAVIGVSLWVASAGWNQTAAAALAGMTLFAVTTMGFVVAQHGGLFGRTAAVFQRRLHSSQWAVVTGNAEALDRATVALYRRRAALLRASAWRMLSWFAGALEAWLILYAIGRPVSPVDAVILESLGQAVRKAAFLVPGAVGVQEGGFMVLGSAMGLAPETGLALSLVKRLRELLVGLPALLSWRFGNRLTTTDDGEPASPG